MSNRYQTRHHENPNKQRKNQQRAFVILFSLPSIIVILLTAFVFVLFLITMKGG